MADIFISYAKEDRLRAKLLAKALETQGWSVWWDLNILPGSTFSQEIEEAISAAKCVIVLWSKKSVDSDWVQNEAAEGARRKILIPVLIDEVEIPLEFRRIQAANLIDWKAELTHTGFNILKDAIAQLLELTGKNTEQLFKYTHEERKPTGPVQPEHNKIKPESVKPTSVKQRIGLKQSIIVIALLAVAAIAAGIWFFTYFEVMRAKPKTIKSEPAKTVLDSLLLTLPKYKGMVLAKAVEDNGMIDVPKEQTSEFYTEDEQVVALVTLENISGDHKLRWEWVDPSGKVYLSTQTYPLKVDKGKYLPKVTAWHRIPLKDEAAADSPGEWAVKLFIDGELIDSKPFVVSVFAEPLMLPPGVSAKPYPKDWGLIIGIEDYKRLPKVKYARKDALIVRDYFIRVLGVPEANIISLIDADATKANIEGYVKKYIPNNIGEDATLYVYFAGHGMPGMKTGEPYLVPFDADTRFIEQTGYKLISFYKDLHKLSVKRVYVFLDSSFSGVASRAAEMLVKGARPALVHVEQLRLPSSSLISLNATSTGQISNAYPEIRHGLFTYYLLRGLKGEADADHDGWSSMKEVYEYVRKHVARQSRRMGSEQTPSITPPSDQWKDVGLSRSLK